MSKTTSKIKKPPVVYRIVEFDSSIDVSNFTCKNSTLDNYIKKFAKQNQKLSISSHYIALADNEEVVGFFVVSMTNISREFLPKEITKGLPSYPYPAGLIAQLAVAHQYQDRGLGRELLLEAMDKILEAKKILGCFAFVTDAINSDAESFYAKYGFLVLDTTQDKFPKRMYLPVKTYEEALKK